MLVSVIIPVYNGGQQLQRCLSALKQTLYEQWECIVVDDGSTDNSRSIARQAGATVIRSSHQPQGGPAHARNTGAHAAKGKILFFIDSDVLVQPGTMGHAVATMLSDSDLVACFGSYDDSPTETNFFSQYRNLLHHYVHQTSSADASTFWSGCGMIRRDCFYEVNGFDTETYPRPSIEDIDLGYRLRAKGYNIRLEKLLQVRHMKRWNLKKMLVTDIRDRALPWTRLIIQGGELPNDLNLQTSQRLSTAVTFLSILALCVGLLWPIAWAVVPVAIMGLIYLNRDFYTFLLQKRGILFTISAMPWHWLYYFYSGLSFAAGVLLYGILRIDTHPPQTIRPSSQVTPPTSTTIE
ncbi:MAG: glycosyltransferase family 2 protein [Chloroflexi bacterium]|nr:glycosyltransferase family 2 protein [Chloroflexota bacterium]